MQVLRVDLVPNINGSEIIPPGWITSPANPYREVFTFLERCPPVAFDRMVLQRVYPPNFQSL
ncbi:UNVERIFIED_CONTAM: hypothetical protein Sradi_3653000 [Sesamum radiatum]|uniref:Uncharacterized protein n=1 Tax=Sesamum radiatum TaxID=300843 RepID=A0AAW2QJ01_SESRA